MVLRWLKGRVIDLIDYENEKLHADNDDGREMNNKQPRCQQRRWALLNFSIPILTRDAAGMCHAHATLLTTVK